MIPLSLRAAQQWQMRAVWVWELNVRTSIRMDELLGELLIYFEYIANQNMSYYSAMSFLLNICVGLQNQGVKSFVFYFIILCIFWSCHSLCVWSLSSSFLPSILSFPNLMGMAFILFCNFYFLYLHSNH